MAGPVSHICSLSSCMGRRAERRPAGRERGRLPGTGVPGGRWGGHGLRAGRPDRGDPCSGGLPAERVPGLPAGRLPGACRAQRHRKPAGRRAEAPVAPAAEAGGWHCGSGPRPGGAGRGGGAPSGAPRVRVRPQGGLWRRAPPRPRPAARRRTRCWRSRAPHPTRGTGFRAFRAQVNKLGCYSFTDMLL